jgi:predicted DNA-binding antitoxin AbrB/MazE fold protein
MSKTLQAVFDGEVFRPEDKIDLRPNTRYWITVEAEADETEVAGDVVHPLTTILNLATDMGVTDLAARHDYYAHGKLEETDNCGS